MLTRDRAAKIHHRLEDLCGDRLELGGVAWVGQVEEWANMQLTLGRVSVERPVHLEPLEDSLEPLEHLDQGFGGHRHVLDERYRPRTPSHPHQEGLQGAAEADETFAFDAAEDRRGCRDQPACPLDLRAE